MASLALGEALQGEGGGLLLNESSEYVSAVPVSLVPEEEALVNEIKLFVDDEHLLEGVDVLKELRELCSTSGRNTFRQIVQQHEALRLASRCEQELYQLLCCLDPAKTETSGWIRVTQETDLRHVWYKEEKDTDSYSFRVEGLCRAPLFNMLSVVYEFDLFKNWFPGISASAKEHELARFRLIASLGMDLPWPMWGMRSVLYAYGDVYNDDSVAIYFRDAVGSDMPAGVDVPAVDESNYVKASCLYGGFHLIPIAEDKTFVKFCFNFDPKIAGLPTSFFNYVAQRTCIPLLGLMSKTARKIEGSEYERRIQGKVSPKSAEIYKEIKERLASIDVLGEADAGGDGETAPINEGRSNPAYCKYLQAFQIKMLEEALETDRTGKA